MSDLLSIHEEIDDITAAMQGTVDLIGEGGPSDQIMGRIIGRVEMLSKRMEAVEMWMSIYIDENGGWK